MTHPLSEELRKLATSTETDGNYQATGWEVEELKAALRRAADALDDLAPADNERLKYQTWLYERNGELSQCKLERDELQRLHEHCRDCLVETAKRAERAEAQAARFREALKWIVEETDFPNSGATAGLSIINSVCKRAREALREPENDRKEAKA